MYVCMYIYIYVYIYIYIYRHPRNSAPGSPSQEHIGGESAREAQHVLYRTQSTPSPPTKSFPIKSPRVELSGRLPIKLYGHENSHPLELRVCLSQTLRNPNS